MKKTIRIDVTRDAIALVTNIVYKNEKTWYGETEKPMRLSMYVPKHKERCKKLMPLLVWLCGGGIQVMDKDIWMPQLLKIAEAGFIVASVEYRTTNDMPLPHPLMDVKAAIRYLRAHHEQYCIDPENVFIMGESAGAMLASLAAVTPNDPRFEAGDYLDQSTAVNAAVDIYGIMDLELSYQNRKSDLIRGVECLQKVGGATVEERIAQLPVFSVINYVTPKTVPFLILHGTIDEKVDIEHSERMYEKLVANGVPCDYYRFENCLHGVDEFYQDEVIEMVIDFLKRYIK